MGMGQARKENMPRSPKGGGASVERLEFSAVLRARAARNRGIRKSDTSKFALIKFTRVEIRMVRNKEV